MTNKSQPDPLIGRRAPDLTLPREDGTQYTLPVGQRPIALFFYPHANGFGCTREMGAVRDAQATNEVYLRHRDLEVVGVSPDQPAKNASFAFKERYAFPLLSDLDGAARKAYNVDKIVFGIAPERKTVFIGPDGVVRNTLVAFMDFFAHAKFVEDELAKLEREGGASPTATVSTTAPAPTPEAGGLAPAPVA